MAISKNKYSAKQLKDIESVKYLANIMRISKKLKNEHNMFLTDLYLLATIYRETLYGLRPITREETLKAYPVMSFRLLKAVDRLVNTGYIVNSSTKPAKSNLRLSITPKSEQLLIHYDRSLRKMSHTINRYLPDEN